MARLLVLDDEEALRRALHRTLRRAGHEVLEASDVSSARRVLAREREVDLVFCDIGLPGESGLELLRALRGSEVPVVMLTGFDDPAVAERALEIGAYAYLVKPVGPNEILINVASALRRRELELAHREYLRELETKVVLRTAALRDALEALRQNEATARLAEADIVARLVTALTLRSEETGGHIRRVGLYAALLAADTPGVRCSDDDIRLAAMLHDVGKIGIPDAVLLKPGPLTDAEYQTMKRHCVLGETLLRGGESPLFGLASEVALTHHERWDGAGYPRGLRAETIPLPGRIVAIADAFDALTTQRVYRDALPMPDAIETMARGRGTQFDPRLLDTFIALYDDLERIRAANPDAAPAVQETRTDRTVVVADEVTSSR